MCINTIIHIKELTTHNQPVHVVDGWVCRRSHPLAIKGNPTSRVMAVEPRLHIVSSFDSKRRLPEMTFAQVHLYFRVHLSFSTNLTYLLVRVWSRSSAIATRQFQMALLVFSKTWQLSHLQISWRRLHTAKKTIFLMGIGSTLQMVQVNRLVQVNQFPNPWRYLGVGSGFCKTRSVLKLENRFISSQIHISEHTSSSCAESPLKSSCTGSWNWNSVPILKVI